MKKHIVDEKTGIGYTLQGDYYIPDLTVPPEKGNRQTYERRHMKKPAEMAGFVLLFS